MTIRAPWLRLLAIVLILTAVSACGPKETPEQKLERFRLNHEIYPLGTNTIFDSEGSPTLLVDVQVTNQGTDKINTLTVLVRVRGEGGVEKIAERVSLDLSNVRPGVGVQMAAVIPGVALEETDEVTVELEANLSPEVLRSLPEFADVPG
ncbi:MAG: hypothetical protein GY906_20255 [bacterium]|nr:hypothetical protein [bacterium]